VAAVLPLLAFASYGASSYAERLSINVTLLLTSATVFFTQGDQLPKVRPVTVTVIAVGWLRLHRAWLDKCI
jgi:hypothetical protein